MLNRRTDAQFWGGCAIDAGDPPAAACDDVIYLPFGRDRPWGLYDAAGRLLEAAAFHWLPERLPYLQDQRTLTPGEVGEPVRLAEGDYIYGGAFNGHFGHFLIDTLPRLWRLCAGLRPGQRVVMHGDGRGTAPSEWFDRPFVRAIFGAIGLTPELIVCSNGPLRIGRIEVPFASLIPQCWASQAFRRLGLALGARLIDRAARPVVPKRIYLSKTRLAAGVGRIANEQAVCEVMKAGGVSIVHPQTLSLSDLLWTLSEAEVIGGWCTSAHHYSLFIERSARFELLAPEAPIANFRLIDVLANNRANYYFPEGMTAKPAGGSRFLSDYVLADPHDTARELLARMTGDDAPPRPRGAGSWARGVFERRRGA